MATEPGAKNVPKNCLFCPALEFDKELNLAYCTWFGNVLPVKKVGDNSEPDDTVERVGKYFAKDCIRFGQKTDGNKAKPRIIQRSHVKVKYDEEEFHPKSCEHCFFHIPPKKIYEDTGIFASGCGARGVAVKQDELVKEATNCKSATGNLAAAKKYPDYQIPDYFPAVRAIYMPEKLFFMDQREEEDTLRLSKKVTDADKARGIKEFRRVVDSHEPNAAAFIPVYDKNFFPPELQKLIPQADDVEHPDKYLDTQGLISRVAMCWFEFGDTPMLSGPAGVGKTELYRHMAYLMQVPFTRISITASTELDDIAGKMHLRDGRTEFAYGRLPKAWQNPGVICIDEPNVGPPDVWQFIRPLTDNSQQLVMDMNGGERISRHQDCYLGLAINPAWDARNYGTTPISDADVSRLMHIYIGMPEEKDERLILILHAEAEGWMPESVLLNYVLKVGADIRKSSEASDVPISWGIRTQLKVLRALHFYSPKAAYRLAGVDFLEPEAGEIIMNHVRSHLPRGKKDTEIIR